MRDEPKIVGEPAIAPVAVRPLEYGRAGYEKKPPAVLPLLGGLIVGMVGVALFGFPFVGVLGGDRRGTVLALMVITGLMFSLTSFTLRHVRSMPRDFWYWFTLGVLLGGGFMMVLTGIGIVIIAVEPRAFSI